MKTSDLAVLTATEARSRMVNGEMTAESYVTACLDRINHTVWGQASVTIDE